MSVSIWRFADLQNTKALLINWVAIVVLLLTFSFGFVTAQWHNGLGGNLKSEIGLVSSEVKSLLSIEKWMQRIDTTSMTYRLVWLMKWLTCERIWIGIYLPTVTMFHHVRGTSVAWQYFTTHYFARSFWINCICCFCRCFVLFCWCQPYMFICR